MQRISVGVWLARRAYGYAFGLSAKSDQAAGTNGATETMPLSQSEPLWSMEGYLFTHKTILLGTDSHLPNHAQVVMQGADVREGSGVRESDAETGKFNLT